MSSTLCNFFSLSSSRKFKDYLQSKRLFGLSSADDGLAGDVLNTISNIGVSFALGLTAVMASTVSMTKDGNMKSSTETVMDGYLATFWLCFGVNIFVLGIIELRLKNIGKVGLKEE